jgi:N-methylhydantoinase B
MPDRMFAAPAGTSGNFSLGGHDPESGQSYVMYVISGGGYGGSKNLDGLTNGCSTIGISKTTPIEVMEQRFPVLFEEYSLHEGSGGAGKSRGGFGVNYTVSVRRGDARASMVMDHGRVGPNGAFGGSEGGVNRVEIERGGELYQPPHRSKDQGIELTAGDRVRVSTPGGGGYGNPYDRPVDQVLADVGRGYYTIDQAESLFGVAIDPSSGEVDAKRTGELRATGAN